MNPAVNDRSRASAGFTIAEISAASFIMLIVITMSLSGFIYALSAAHRSDIQDTLDTDVQKAIERLKHDLRLTSLDEVTFYPEGPGPYTAISFPRATANAEGLLATNSEGKIAWDTTIIYHKWSGSPEELRVTTFYPRDNTLNADERYEQLEDTVTYGTGTNDNVLTYTNATTVKLFENLFDWNVARTGSPVLGYNDELARQNEEVLGSIVLSPNAHTLKFSVIGKEPASSAMKVGIDFLKITPSRSAFEAEDMFPVTASNGPAPFRQYMLSNGTWSADYQLLQVATASGNYMTVTFNNDQWFETSFRGTGESHSNTVIHHDSSYSMTDRVVMLEGPGTSWWATAQTDDPDGRATNVAGEVVRVLLRGDRMVESGFFAFSGQKSKLCFRASTNGNIMFHEIYIARAADDYTITPNAQGGQTDCGMLTAMTGTNAWTSLVDFPIDKLFSYVVSFRVSPGMLGNALMWTNDPSIQSCWVSPAGALQLEPEENNWLAFPMSFYATNAVIALEKVFVTHPDEGIFESQVFDTKKDVLTNAVVNWHIAIPSNSSIELRVRSWDTDNMSLAPLFEDMPAVVLPYSMPADTKRYLQFRASLYPSPDKFFSSQLRDVLITWSGDEVYTDITATYSKGPDYGIFKPFVDDQELTRALTISLSIFQDTYVWRGAQRLTSTLTAEVQPRNTGR